MTTDFSLLRRDPIYTIHITDTGGNIGHFVWCNTQEHLIQRGTEWWRIWGNCWWEQGWPHRFNTKGFTLMRGCTTSLPGEFIRFHAAYRKVGVSMETFAHTIETWFTK